MINFNEYNERPKASLTEIVAAFGVVVISFMMLSAL